MSRAKPATSQTSTREGHVVEQIDVLRIEITATTSVQDAPHPSGAYKTTSEAVTEDWIFYQKRDSSEVLEIEKCVGKYSVDILAHVEGVVETLSLKIRSPLPIMITSGKAIAYAAGVNVNIIV